MTAAKKVRVLGIGAGGTLTMRGKPLVSSRTSDELLEGMKVDRNTVELSLRDLKELMDSTNMLHMVERLAIANIILEVIRQFDAIVVFQGTDSLADTCAYLAGVFKDTLQIPVIVIGAQYTKDEPGSDVSMQIENAVRTAVAFVRREIVGVFSICLDKVLDGPRVRKQNEHGVQAFHTPGRAPVAECAQRIVLHHGLRRLDSRRHMSGVQADTNLAQNVITMVASADNPAWVLHDQIEASGLDGVILICRGAGQLPNRKLVHPKRDGVEYDWISTVAACTEAGIPVAVVSPFDDGRVDLTRYELGVLAAKAGAISCGSLTLEMADVLFRIALARFGSDAMQIQAFLLANFVCEHLPGEELDDDTVA